MTYRLPDLTNVDNTSDVNKPVSTAQQAALDLKANLAGPTFTGTVTVPTPFTIGAVSVTATGTELNFVVGVTSGIQAQINAKQATLVSATNIKTVNGTTLLGSGDLVVTGTAPDISLSILAPAVDETITAGYSAVVVRKYKIASGKKLTIGLAARMRVL